MLFTITGKHIEITEAIKEYAQSKTSRLPRYYSGINKIEVIIDRGQGINNGSVEIIASGEHKNVFVVSHAGNDIYKCIDLAVRKLERKIKRKKERQRNNKHITDFS